jgi:hypothetical protein
MLRKRYFPSTAPDALKRLGTTVAESVGCDVLPELKSSVPQPANQGNELAAAPVKNT